MLDRARAPILRQQTWMHHIHAFSERINKVVRDHVAKASHDTYLVLFFSCRVLVPALLCEWKLGYRVVVQELCVLDEGVLRVGLGGWDNVQ